MAILLTNDDGYFAKGIQELNQTLMSFSKVKVIAPKANCSGLSASITLRKDIHVEKITHSNFIVNGTPADCSYLGLTSLFAGEISQVVSGINLGANLGNDVLYSGTVGAALAGRGLEFPPVAISVAAYEPKELSFIAKLSSNLVQRIRSLEIDPNLLININFPDITENQYKGTKITVLNKLRPTSFPDVVDPSIDNPIFQIGPSSISSDASDDSDHKAISEGFVSVSLLDYSFTTSLNLFALDLEKELNA
ncbi:MAG: 5'/3'-nucleotidase SurE [Gammaproteobacteria bacterium]|jgi:5'-nucleotidase